ncbi:MAG: glycosyltransferase [Acetobacteraceae bacterium]|nr:glycosyltransferase [Acetobacteraceae bacterium]
MTPFVSVIVANFNGERHLAAALRSILAQSLTTLEVLLVDDASTDTSVTIANAIAAEDRRLRVVRLTTNAGPAAARNVALSLARGQWIAVVDSDDIIHPDRLARLVSAGETAGADIVADDMLVFHDDCRLPPRRFLAGTLAAAPSWITATQYICANRLFSRAAPLGYLKPLIRTSFLTDMRVRYTENMQIAEDFDLILRLLVRGARFWLVPELLYFYRRHDASISHRLSPATLSGMEVADARFRLWAGTSALAPLLPALNARLASIHAAAAAETAIVRLKAAQPLAALAALAVCPDAVPIVARLASPSRLLARLRRRRGPATPAPANPSRPRICVLSRQRLTAGANGSTAYLLSLCRALADAGYALDLICPSPSVLGRVPILRVAGDGVVFDRVAIRGTFRLGKFFITRDPRVFLRAAIGVLDRVATRFGIRTLAAFAKPAPYAVGLEWSVADCLFVAAEARGKADIILADYGFLTPGIPYALSPGAATAVVMHDLFSARPAAFATIGAEDSVATLSEAGEADLLGRAGLVIAIQQDEAAVVERLLPSHRSVVVAPMALEPVAAPQPGEGDGILFVGSGTAPNVDAMRWFLAEIWPLIQHAQPQLRLNVAGAVCSALTGRTYPGVTLLGRVADLDGHYRRADVVISPLRAGSGLKIKLIEALAHGKAVVATSVTAQGVADRLQGAVVIADSAGDFAGAILALLADPTARGTLAAAALSAASRHFSAETAYRGVIDHFRTQLEHTRPQINLRVAA